MCSERGDVTIEFIGVTLVLLLPLIQLILIVATLESASFAAESSVREVSRALAVGAGKAGELEAVAKMAFGDQGLKARPQVVVACEDGQCRPGKTASVKVSARVTLPGVPAIIGKAIDTSVPVSAGCSVSIPRDGYE